MSEKQIDRRSFLAGSAAAVAGVYVAGNLTGTFEGASPLANAVGATTQGYGELVPDPAGLLDLPKGFSYKIVAHAGETVMEDGNKSASDPDGTGFYPAAAGGALGSVGGAGVTGGHLILNHEIGGTEPHLVPVTAGVTYDDQAGGGCTVIAVNAGGERQSEFVGVAGTVNNCAGGQTPWGTWLTCEETEVKKGELAVAGKVASKDHGWVFEVSPDKATNATQAATPLKFLGRYAHEAVAVNPADGTIYLTEDAGKPNGLMYRWTPPAGFKPGPGALAALATSDGGELAGKLEMMKCFDNGTFVPDLSPANKVGTTYTVEWVEVPGRDRLAETTSIRKQPYAETVTRSRKLEGAWWKNGAYIVASFARASDGSAAEHDGQVWHFSPDGKTITLHSVFGRNPNPDVDLAAGGNFDGPDNITVSPWGGVIVSEDGEGVQHIVGINDKGEAYPIARNRVSDSEFAGPVFSADGRVLYFSIQEDGYTFAVTGPWSTLAGGTGAMAGGSVDTGSLNTGSLGS